MGGLFSSPPEVANNVNAPHKLTVQYCGGWGYYRYAAEVASKIEEAFPGQFMFDLQSDAGTTGRLEVTVYPNYK